MLEGERIFTEGFAVFEHEGTALYVSQGDYQNGIILNGIWLSLTAEDARKYASLDKKYVYAVGTYSGKFRGHASVFSGSLRVENLAAIPTALNRP